MEHKTLNKQRMMIVEQMLKNAQTPLLYIHVVISCCGLIAQNLI
jgi:hypothetical protein